MLTLWINLYRVPLDSFPILFGGPQKMITGLLSVRCSSSLIFRTTRKTLEWATTLREVWFPTSVSYPMVGASFIRITHSVRSISSPAPVPRTWLELVTSAQLWQCRVIFLTKKKKRQETFYQFMMPGRITTNYFGQSNSFLICGIISASTGFNVIKLWLWIFSHSLYELDSLLSVLCPHNRVNRTDFGDLIKGDPELAGGIIYFIWPRHDSRCRRAELGSVAGESDVCNKLLSHIPDSPTKNGQQTIIRTES